MNDNSATTALLERLDQWGAMAVDGPDPAWAARLDEHLRLVRAQLVSETATPPPSRPRWATQRRAVLAPVVALVVVLAAAALASLLGSDPAEAMRLDRAADTRVVLPDGAVVDGVAGLEVPDGSVIRTGPEGEAEIDGTVIWANQIYVVDGDDVRPVEDDDVLPEPSTASSAGPSTTAGPQPGSADQPDPGTRPTPTTARPIPSRPASPRPSTTRPQVPTTARPNPTPTTPAAVPTTSTTTPTTPAPPPAPPTTTTTVARPRILDLQVEVDPAGVTLRWSAYTGPGFQRYVVIRSIRRTGQVVATVVASIGDQAATSWVDDPPDRLPAAGYRVVALGPADRPLAASAVVAVDLSRSDTPAPTVADAGSVPADPGG